MDIEGRVDDIAGKNAAVLLVKSVFDNFPSGKNIQESGKNIYLKLILYLY